MVDTGFYATPAQRARLATVYGPADGGGLREVEIETVPFTEKPALLEGAGLAGVGRGSDHAGIERIVWGRAV